MAPDDPRMRPTVLGFLLAMVLLPMGAVCAGPEAADRLVQGGEGEFASGVS
jgi:hypothetical protein